MEFPYLLTSEVLKTPTDSSPDRLSHLYALIRACLLSPVLCPSFSTDTTFQAIVHRLGALPPRAECERWEAIVAFCTVYPSEYAVTMLPIAVDLLERPLSAADRAAVAALRTVTVLLHTEAEIGRFLAESQLHASVMRLLRRFPDHTFLQRAAAAYAIAAIENPVLRRSAVRDFVAPLIEEVGKCRMVGAMAAVVYEVGAHAGVIAEGDQVFEAILRGECPDWEEFWEKRLKERERILADGYGGKCPELCCAIVKATV
jgi:hypothetical protein